jgi:hypothetical protein
VSRSWIERLRPPAFAVREAAGIAIGRGRVACAWLVVGDRGWTARALREAALERRLFAGRPDDETRQALVEALKTVTEGLARRYVAVNLSLPDAAATSASYELEALPKSAREQQALARFRLGRDAFGEIDIACGVQDLGADADKRLLFAVGIEQAWLTVIVAAVREAGLTPWAASTDATWRFNSHHRELVANGSGALVGLSPEAWSLLIWDAGGRPRLLRGKWRADPGAGDYTDLAAEIERVSVAYVHGGPGRTLGRVYVSGVGADADGLIRALDARLHEPCTALLPGTGLELPAEAAGVSLLAPALAAATAVGGEA